MIAGWRAFWLASLSLVVVLAGCGHQERGRAPISAPDSTSAASAVAWIHDYYKAINDHRYRDAYEHWDGGGQASGKSFDEFRKGFEETERSDVTTGTPGPIGAAAGSRYIEVPIQIAARTRAGAQQRFSGSYTLRLSVVDGATPEQRSWHIYSAAVRPE